jgi:hypothetical protein
MTSGGGSYFDELLVSQHHILDTLKDIGRLEHLSPGIELAVHHVEKVVTQ